MRYQLTQEEILSYRNNGFIVIDDFLDPRELENWRRVIDQAVKNRSGIKIPGQTIKTGEDDGINDDPEYFSKVFDQIINLWQTDEEVKELILDERIGKMAADLSGSAGIRPWHDQALIKGPWANPTSWHLDTPFWSFSHREALSIWIALDDATLRNGCLYFIPGSHKKTSFENYGITKNMDAIFEYYPAYGNAHPVPATMKAGSCSFHNGLCIHGANANMTPDYRRAMTCAFMPDGSTFNGNKNILSDSYFQSLKPGDLLNNDNQNPLIYHRENNPAV